MSKNNNNTPRLRFPGFTGEWEEKKLGEVASSFSGGTPKSSESKYYGGDIPFIRSGEIHGCKTELYITEEGLNKSSAKLVSKGDLLIALYGATSGEVAISKIDGAINQAILCVRSQSINSNYLCNYLEYKKDTITSKFLQGGQGNLSSDIIMSLNIPSPTPAEQRKIASCLSAMDNLISAQSQKVEALKDQKKGMMQQLFPQKGETTPRLRFPEFTGEWEEKTLGEVCNTILVGYPFKGNEITDDITGHPILRAYCIGEGFIRHGKDYDKYYPNNSVLLDKYKVKCNDIVISMDGSVGKNIALVTDLENNYLLIQRVARLRITNYPVQLIYQQIISQRFKDYAAGEKVGAVIAHISQKQIEAFPILIPKSPSEQKKIADCLSELDTLIASETKQLEALKDHKKGLMQQLFPQPAK